MLELLAQTGLNALYSASYISLVAVGLVLIFGVMGIVNFAHGELFMVGAYVVVALYSNYNMPFILVAAIGLIFVGCIGLLMERTMFRPLRDNPLGGLVASIGFLMILQALASMTFGVRMAFVPPVTQEVIEITDKIRLPVQRLYVILAAIGFLTALWLFLTRTRFGWALRASAQDPEAAALQGISINQTAKIAMFIGAALAGVAGRADRAADIGEPPYGPFRDHRRLHRGDRRRRRIARRRRRRLGRLCLRPYLRDNVLRRRDRRHNRPVADASRADHQADRPIRDC